MFERQVPQDVLTAMVGVLMAWSILQVRGPYDLPLWLVSAAAAIAVVALGLWRTIERRVDAPLASRAGPESGLLRPLWIVGAIGLVGLLLRLHTFPDRVTWADEMWTLRNIYTSSWSELLRVAFEDYWPPLHYLLLNGVARITDTSLVWLRLPSVLYGAATVVVMYPLGKQLLRSRVAALFAAGLLAGMTSHILYSQEARVYALQVFLAVLSAHFFFRSYWERRISASFLFTTTLLTYSHSFASWYFIAAQTVYVFAARYVGGDREAQRRGFQSQVLVVLLWLPLVAAFAFSRLSRDILVPTYWATGAETPPGILDLIEQYQGLAVRSWAGAALMTMLIGLAGLRLLRAMSRDRSTLNTRDGDTGPALLFLALWATVPVFFSLCVTVLTSLDTFGEIRYHLTVLPALCLLAGAGTMSIRSRPALAAVSAMVVLLPLAELPRFYAGYRQPSIDRAAEIVRTERRAGEPIYVGSGFRAFAYYYRGAFPRIGSEEWERLAAAHASLDSRYTMESTKWGDTYAYEKIPPEVRFYGYFRGRDWVEQFQLFIASERDSGRLSGPFWIVGGPESSRVFRQTLREEGIECGGRERFAVRQVDVRRCVPGDADPGITVDRP